MDPAQQKPACSAACVVCMPLPQGSVLQPAATCAAGAKKQTHLKEEGQHGLQPQQRQPRQAGPGVGGGEDVLALHSAAQRSRGRSLRSSGAQFHDSTPIRIQPESSTRINQQRALVSWQHRQAIPAQWQALASWRHRHAILPAPCLHEHGHHAASGPQREEKELHGSGVRGGLSLCLGQGQCMAPASLAA